ncbi:MAG: hypothetical protein Q8865_05505 [Bacillota bacterium]|nr:hypothetical protein [Bacillota bacterium]
MACDFSELKKLEKKILKMQDKEAQKFFESAAGDIAHELAEKNMPAAAKPVAVIKKGNVYTAEVAASVLTDEEYGHKSDGKWIQGKFNLKTAEQQTASAASKLLQNKLAALMEGCFNGK